MKTEQYFFYLLHSIELGKDVPKWLKDEAKKYKQEYYEEKYSEQYESYYEYLLRDKKAEDKLKEVNQDGRS